MNFSAVINNLPGALFDVQNDATLVRISGGGNPSFNNQGTFRKSAGAGVTTIEIFFDNTGTIEELSGTVIFAGGGRRASVGSQSPAGGDSS